MRRLSGQLRIELLICAICYVASIDDAAAVDRCRAAVNVKTGAIEVSAGVAGSNPRWGTTPGAAQAAFANEAQCFRPGKLRKCIIDASGTEAGRALPAWCTIYVDDTAGPVCAAFIKGCAPTQRDRGSDGVVQINQTRALAGGVTAGDAPGFPVTISVPGSYRLTSDLAVPAATTTAIDVTSSDVTLDLNGFSLLGPVVCSGGPPVTACAPPGGGDGIKAFVKENLVVTNGTIGGMGGNGIDYPSLARIEGVRVISNGNQGIGSFGGSMLLDNVVSFNGNRGISGGSDGMLLVLRNAVYGNDNGGILAFDYGNVIVGNHATLNASQGIYCQENCNVRENVVSGNTSHGLWFFFAASSGYGANVVNQNNGGNANPQVSGVANQFAVNVCRDTMSCP